MLHKTRTPRPTSAHFGKYVSRSIYSTISPYTPPTPRVCYQSFGFLSFLLNMFDGTATFPSFVFFDTKSWYTSPNRSIAPRPWFLPITFLAFALSLMLPRPLRLTVATPALMILVSQTRAFSSGKVATDFSVAALIFGYVLKWVDYGMLVEEGELYRVNANDSGAQEEDLESRARKERERGFWQRFKDAMELFAFNLRGIGWNWRVGGISQSAPRSKPYISSFFLYMS
jgi:hypothetical protein